MESELRQLGESLAVVQWMSAKTPWRTDLTALPNGPVHDSFFLRVEWAVENYLHFAKSAVVGTALFPGVRCRACKGNGRWKEAETVSWLNCPTCNGTGGRSFRRNVLAVEGLSRPLIGAGLEAFGSEADGVQIPDWLRDLSLFEVCDAWVSAGYALRNFTWHGCWVDASWIYGDLCDQCRSSRNPELVPLFGNWTLPFVFSQCRHKQQSKSWGTVLPSGEEVKRETCQQPLVPGNSQVRDRCFDVRCSLLNSEKPEASKKFGNAIIGGNHQEQYVVAKFCPCRVACEAESPMMGEQSEQTGYR